jgi:tetratricopeptide (TPR) repeat protein
MSFSIWSLFGRNGREGNSAEGDRRLAQKLVDRGIAAEAAGDARKALEHFRKAVAADDTYPPAHMNLGIALHLAGEIDAAIAAHERAITADPHYAAAHFNLGRAMCALARFTEAEAAYRVALALRDDFPEALVGLADALEALGRDDAALATLEQAIAKRVDYAGAMLNAILLQRRMGRFEGASEASRRLLALEPENVLAHVTLGIGLKMQGRLDDAEASFRQALAFNPVYTPAKLQLALVLQSLGRNPEAIPLLFDLVAGEPDNGVLRRSLAEALNGCALQEAGDSERTVLCRLCADDEISMRYLNTTFVSLLKQHEGFWFLLASAGQGESETLSDNPAVAAFLRDPLLLASLPRMALCDAALEEVLAHVRRCLILHCTPASVPESSLPGIPEDFVCALARQCFYANYALYAQNDEVRRVALLREPLKHALREDTLTPRALEFLLARSALYDPLHALYDHERLLARPAADWSAAFAPMLAEQIGNRLRERAIAQELTAITGIADRNSLAVRAQYEENPYPRWVTMQRVNRMAIEDLQAHLRPGQEIRVRPPPVQILVAGCGTGHVSVLFAHNFPESEILAVDLSLSSLAYAVRMTAHFGVSNITYRQADILALDRIDRRFALIECSGVLHHLDDPMAGWRVLTRLLEADGLMRIGLYSEKAREAVTAAREFAASLNLPLTAEGIRECRHAIAALPESHPARKVMTYGDYYTLDTCRDLIMNVREHRFTLPRIEQCLELLGLEFLEMETTAATRKRFEEMFPDRDAARQLDAWHHFEEAYPDTFRSMYSFWCGPREGSR